MSKKILHFVRYHNMFILAAAVLIMGSGALAASDDLQSALLSSEEKILSVDNSALLAADFNAFNPSLHITDIIEDEERYYITYRHKTMGIEDYTWKELEKEELLKVDKALLIQKGRDLGLYVAEELGEVASFNLSYLKEVQGKEKQTGQTQKVATVEYAGLIGRFLEPEEKVFPGYVPVVKEISPESQPQEQAAANHASIDPNLIKQIVKEEVEKILKSRSPSDRGSSTSLSEDKNEASGEKESGTTASEPQQTTQPQAQTEPQPEKPQPEPQAEPEQQSQTVEPEPVAPVQNSDATSTSSPEQPATEPVQGPESTASSTPTQ